MLAAWFWGGVRALKSYQSTDDDLALRRDLGRKSLLGGFQIFARVGISSVGGSDHLSDAGGASDTAFRISGAAGTSGAAVG